MRWLELILVGIVSGAAAAFLGSWVQRLRDYDVARLLITGEIVGNLASSRSMRENPTLELNWLSAAWMKHRESLAPRLQLNDYEAWAAIASVYETVLLPAPSLIDEPLDEKLEALLDAANRRLMDLSLRRFETLFVYGPLAAIRGSRRLQRSKQLSLEDRHRSRDKS